MKKENCFILKKQNERVFSFLLSDGKAVEIHCDPVNDISLLGNVYIGRVRDVVKNINAVFVEIVPGVICHLPLKEGERAIYTKKGSSQNIQQGDELLVQVCREGIKTKYPSVTTNITLHGKYLLLTSGEKRFTVSKKISVKRKEELLQMMNEFTQHGDVPYGLLVRTNAELASETMIRSDFERLSTAYQKLIQESSHRTLFSCLSSSPGEYLKRISNLYSDKTDHILTDDPELYRQIKEYLLENNPEDLEKLAMYEDRLLPVEKLYSLEHKLREALDERVWLKSGAYLVIQPTEALTVIDVNTGKCDIGKDPEKNFLKVNLEAAAEISRQIRLRNLSGIIIIDFINMKSEEHTQELMQQMRRLLKEDPILTTLVDMTKLSLMEITRKKIERPLYEQIKLTDL